MKSSKSLDLNLDSLIATFRNPEACGMASPMECESAGEELERLRAERDEARREVCEMPPRTYIKQAYAYAYLRGWDCYKNQETP
jgi:hypothetical protein